MATTMKQATALLVVIVAMATVHAQRDVQAQARAAAIPRLADGRPDMQGVWQARSRAAYGLEDHPARYGMPAGRSVVDTINIPYHPWAAMKQRENFDQR